ncbi:MAG TPA: leucyl aminopeptidase [Dehalococcoidia bacterium]|nr:leucyl aminopeptidase [Dehalococcoidia bacterium]
MEIKVERGDLAEHPAKAVIVNLFEGVKSPGGGTGAVDKALDGAISQLIAEGETKGKKAELTLVHTLGKLPTPRVLVVGLGKQADFNLDVVRDVTGTALRRCRAAGASTAATIVHGAGIAGLDAEACAQAIAEGAVMGLYRFDRLKKPDKDQKRIESVTLVERDESKLDTLKRGVQRGRVLGEAVNHARDMANEPANLFTPSVMAERAQALAKDAGLECQVLEQAEMEKMGMGALLGVAVGSVQPPKFIILRHRGDRGGKETIGLLGKGITFDSGGISIKPAAGMEEMKGDMSGGAAVIAALWALAKLKAPVNVTGLVPTTENMPSGSATKPGDVLKAMNGKTIEVINTDAEGRLILADAICYARKEKLSPIVDVATLTGAMQIALGPAATGFMATDDALAEAVVKAGESAGERMWRFPLIDEYREGLKSQVADIKNTGNRYGGAISAAKFLHYFAEDSRWVHIDMAPTDNFDKDKGAWVKGASGIPTRTLVGLVLSLAGKRA